VFFVFFVFFAFFAANKIRKFCSTAVFRLIGNNSLETTYL